MGAVEELGVGEELLLFLPTPSFQSRRRQEVWYFPHIPP